jgi:hypothetical protein
VANQFARWLSNYNRFARSIKYVLIDLQGGNVCLSIDLVKRGKESKGGMMRGRKKKHY